MLPLEHSKLLINSIVPKFSYNIGDDVTTFQKNGCEMLTKLLGINKIQASERKNYVRIEYDKQCADLNCREIRFFAESENNVFVPCHLFIPNHLNYNALIISLHGHSTGMHVLAGREKYKIDKVTISDQECDFAKQAILLGFPTLTIEQRGFGERGGNENGSLCSELSFRSIMMGRTLVGERVFDTMHALNALLYNSIGDIRFDKIICIGYSGGGTVATYLSALDNRINHAILVSAISTFRDSICAMPHCACNYIPNILENFDMGNICQLIAPRELTIVSGINDNLFPVLGAKESFNQALKVYKAYNSESKITHIVTNGGHRFYPREVWSHLTSKK